MAIFKCKMCGGSLNVEPNASVVECEYCGTKQTVPKLDDDKRANLYDRANHFRRSNEYDKAMAIYEQILNEEPADAEAYWSLVLCRYGIEYVEDPLTHKRVPTVNRAQFTSVYSDEDYKSALKYADGSQRIVYEDEAKAIDDIQKGILEISQKESPFDVFICYKETDSNGRRTQDSVLANDLYHQLTQEGFKVFFARITLEDKLGSAYEPYIFAALNSAKVMVVLGTKPEYFNAVWVKNEWSRYLALIKKGAKKMLIPAYRDMDPYDLPEEFSHLQAQDMSKLGFMQDLIRGIKKIVAKSEPKQAQKETVILNGGANAAPLLKRAFIFLEDGNWAEADEYCEKVLDQDPENAQAYLGKLMAEKHACTQEKLADCKTPFDNSNNFNKAVKYGGEELAATLNGYVSGIKERNEQARLNSVYNSAMQKMEHACSERDYNAAAQQFKSIQNFKNSAALAEECLNKAEEIKRKAEEERKNRIYKTAIKKMYEMAEGSFDSGEQALSLLNSIPGWKDADERAEECKRTINELREQNKAACLAFIAEEKRKNKIKAIIAASLIVGGIFVILLTTVIIPTINNNKIYDAGVYLYQNGRYDEAIETFESLNGYKDSKEYIKKCCIARYGIDYWNEYNAINVGDEYVFGSYEQDNNLANGNEEISWIVLDKKNCSLFLISKYALDRKKYNDSYARVAWYDCSLRTWLNSDFYNAAFNEQEKSKIKTTLVTADKNPEIYGLVGSGSDVDDRVFLLSITEANKYFLSDDDRKCEATAYLKKRGVYRYKDDRVCPWWLRTTGSSVQTYAAYVDDAGRVSCRGTGVNSDRECIRPAIWITL